MLTASLAKTKCVRAQTRQAIRQNCRKRIVRDSRSQTAKSVWRSCTKTSATALRLGYETRATAWSSSHELISSSQTWAYRHQRLKSEGDDDAKQQTMSRDSRGPQIKLQVDAIASVPVKRRQTSFVNSLKRINCRCSARRDLRNANPCVPPAWWF